MPFDPKIYLSIFWSRFPVFLCALLAMCLVGLTLIKTLPKIYVANALLLVEDPQIPQDLAASTVRTDLSQQVQIIEQKLLTRDNLLALADRFGVFADSPGMQPDRIVVAMRDRIRFERSGGQPGNVTVVNVSAEAETAEVAAGIVNDLVGQALNRDASFRNEVATNTLSFFEREVQRLGEVLDTYNTRILDFQNANVDALPETLEYRMSRQAQLQERLGQIRREISQLGDQRRRLITLFETTGATAIKPTGPLSTEEQELEGLRAQLRESLSVFSEANPRVVALKSRIARLEQLVSGQAPDEAAAEPRSTTVYDAQLQEIDSQIEELRGSTKQLNGDIEALQETIDRTPANEIALNAMLRNRENTQAQYNTAVERLSAAATGERIEVLSKGQRLTVIEPAVVPSKPAKPSRMLIAAGSVGGGIVLGLAAIVLIELLKPTIRSPGQLSRSLGITPLGTLPYVETPGEIWRRRSFRLAVTLVVLGAALGSLLFINTDFIPLAEMAQKVLANGKL